MNAALPGVMRQSRRVLNEHAQSAADRHMAALTQAYGASFLPSAIARCWPQRRNPAMRYFLRESLAHLRFQRVYSQGNDANP